MIYLLIDHLFFQKEALVESIAKISKCDCVSSLLVVTIDSSNELFKMKLEGHE